jgi:DNA topoisomerase-2
MAFSKKAIDQRKDWLTNWMEEGKRRKELGLSEVYLYEKNTKAVTYKVSLHLSTTSLLLCCA